MESSGHLRRMINGAFPKIESHFSNITTSKKKNKSKANVERILKMVPWEKHWLWQILKSNWSRTAFLTLWYSKKMALLLDLEMWAKWTLISLN